MRKGWLIILSVVCAGGVFAAVALAAPHFTKGGTPTCTDTGNQLVCTGSLAGLGNQDLVIHVESPAEATFACGNPGKKNNQAPGINKIPFEATGSATITGEAIKNGRARFRVVAPETPPPTPTPTQAGCPNPNWVVKSLSDVEFGAVTLTIRQGGVLLFTCTAPDVPENGTVTLSCSSA